MEISIVIPVYNAEDSIAHVIENLQQDAFLKSKKWELILVDDYSSDNSYTIISSKAKEYSNLLGLSLHKNVGQHNATLAGISQAKGELLITMDDDGEHPVQSISNLIEKLFTHKADVVFAVADKNRKNSFRRLASKTYKLFTRAFSDGYGNGSSFRLMRKDIYRQLTNHTEPFVFIDELLAWYTKNVSYCSVSFNKSLKKSTYRTKKLLGLYSNILFTYSSFPAQLLTRLGLSGSIISFFLGLYFILRKLFFKAKLGFTSISVSILFSASIILLGLGIIAQYIYRQNKLLNKYPQYSIKDRTDD